MNAFKANMIARQRVGSAYKYFNNLQINKLNIMTSKEKDTYA